MTSDAYISACGQYRYWLSRIWSADKPLLGFVMLNPSTASASTDDPTIRRCVRFAGRWGYAGISVCNLFAFRSPSPSVLYSLNDPVGPDNDQYIQSIMATCQMTICAWGTKGSLMGRDQQVAPLLANTYCLERTKEGHPKHPLYVRGDIIPQRFTIS